MVVDKDLGNDECTRLDGAPGLIVILLALVSVCKRQHQILYAQH